MEGFQLNNTLKEFFGYDHFRPLQEDIIHSLLDRKDCLVIMPTGGGKSICYQLPALLLDGITLVISPLIALMKDQVDGLNANGIPAAFINSSQPQEEQESIFSRLISQQLKLIYIAPESLSLLDPLLNQVKVSLIAIDEAHCISSWGHDFRPAYTQLGYLKKRFGETPLVALTATADKATREDICKQLNIQNAKRFVASFDRKNLSLDVRPGTNRIEQILSFLNDKPLESGIIYCLSRKTTENLSAKLKKQGFQSEAYHAGLSHADRTKVQEDFINDEVKIVCATIAFGMGIDKSNVRWVIHYNLPKNIEGYYQEIGRAGRDGLPSSTLLFHSYADVIQLQRFADMSGNQEVQIAKLERMRQYAEALTCRRKILLSYFGELIDEDCGNCDICKDPPQFIDGTVMAQMALSVVVRVKSSEPIQTIIDILRGSQNQTILEKGYQNLKTYGLGNHISWQDWQQYIIQLINQGYLEIAFHLNNKLQITEKSKKVLFENEKVKLAHASEFKKVNENQKSIKKVDENSLFERLRKLRLHLAKENEIPAYQIFNDATLKEMEKIRPITDEEFLQVNGVGKQKMMDYGYDFIKEIISFSKDKRQNVTRKKKGNTYRETLKLYQEAYSIEEISEKRALHISTIYSHLIKLYEQGENIELKSFIADTDLIEVKNAKEKLNDPSSLKTYFEHFEEAMDYQTIKIALAIIDKSD